MIYDIRILQIQYDNRFIICNMILINEIFSLTRIYNIIKLYYLKLQDLSYKITYKGHLYFLINHISDIT